MRHLIASFLLSIGFLAILAGAQSPTAVRYRVTERRPVSGLCYCCARPADINEDETVVGTASVDDADASAFYDAVLEPATHFFLPGSGSGAAGVNNLNEMVGHFWVTGAFVWSRAGGIRMAPEVEPGVRPGYGRTINDVGLVAVMYFSSDGYFSFIWDLRTEEIVPIADLPGGLERSYSNAINSTGVVVGSSATGWDGTPESTEAFIWTAEAGSRPLGRLEDGTVLVSADGISDTGVIVGTARHPDSLVREPYIGSPLEGYELLPRSSADTTYETVSPFDINNERVVVGQGQLANFVYHAVVWTPGRGLRRLQNLLDPCDRITRDVQYAGGINERGAIVVFDDRGCRRADKSILVLSPYLIGNFDSNAGVDANDLSILLSHFGQLDGAAFADGDTDCDGDVDLQDLAALLGSLGETLP